MLHLDRAWPHADELRYVMEYLDAAKSFTASLAPDGLGLVAMIG